MKNRFSERAFSMWNLLVWNRQEIYYILRVLYYQINHEAVFKCPVTESWMPTLPEQNAGWGKLCTCWRVCSPIPTSEIPRRRKVKEEPHRVGPGITKNNGQGSSSQENCQDVCKASLSTLEKALHNVVPASQERVTFHVFISSYENKSENWPYRNSYSWNFSSQFCYITFLLALGDAYFELHWDSI